MSKQEEAEQKWTHQDYDIARILLESGDGLQRNTLADLQCGARDSFKLALTKEIEKELSDYIRIRDRWKQGTNQYATYDLAVRIWRDHLKSLNEVKPLEP